MNIIEPQSVDTKLSLTTRQREVLHLVANGQNNDEIGRILGISKKTAERHRLTIRHKLKANNSPHAVAKGIRLGLIPLEAIP